MVRVNNTIGTTPLTGEWLTTTEGGSTILEAEGPALMNIHTPSGDVEVEVPEGRTCTITITGTVSEIRYS